MDLKTLNSHKRDRKIEFIEKGHLYYINGKRYSISVTGFVHSFFPKFKADEIISKMMMSRNWEQSKYYGMEPEEIKQEWKLGGMEASKLGTELHKSIEQYYNECETPNETTEYDHFLNFQKDHAHLKPFRTEWEIFDEDLELAGSVDMIFQDENGEYHMYDWKRSKEIKENNAYEEGHFPLSHIPNANYWHYSLQLNIYKQILEKNYGIQITDLYIVQFHPNQEKYNKIKCSELQSEVLDMFKDRYQEVSAQKESRNI